MQMVRCCGDMHFQGMLVIARIHVHLCEPIKGPVQSILSCFSIIIPPSLSPSSTAGVQFIILPMYQMRRLLASCSLLAFGGAGHLLLPLFESLPLGWVPAARVRAGNVTHGMKVRKGNKSYLRRAKIRRPAAEDQALARALRAITEAALRVSMEYEQVLWGRRSRESWRRNTTQDINASNKLGMSGLALLPRFRQWGPIGVLYIPLVPFLQNVILSGQNSGRSLLSREAWAWLRDFFQAPETSVQVRRRSPVHCAILECAKYDFFPSP